MNLETRELNTEARRERTYLNNGFYLVDLGLAEKVAEIRRSFINVFSTASQLNGLPAVRTDEEIERLYSSANRSVWVAAYSQLRRLPSIHALSNDKEVTRVLREKVSITFPALAVRPIVRADMPNDDKWRFSPHQDFSFNQGSLNSVTVWLPFQDTSFEMGALQVIPASHKKGALKCDDEGTLRSTEFKASEFISVPVKAGQALIFSAFLVHQSGHNRSNQIRFSMQLRYNDLNSSEYAKRQYYVNEVSGPGTTQVSFETYFPEGEAM